MIDNKLTYISLFSSAGVGCYGFKMEGFECIASNELIGRRLQIQKFNHKCKYSSGYIQGDITKQEIRNQIYQEINLWREKGNDKVDVVIATPPCQGMSVANHKKKVNEIERNSLIVESVKIVREILPRFFIFENVAAFWKTGCTYRNNVVSIGDMINSELSTEYLIEKRILNFKNYGSNSSRTRTLVIGVHKSLSDRILPLELFPSYQEEKTLRSLIYDMPRLEWGEFQADDFYHSFRIYPIHMRQWISDLQEGQSAFDNIEDVKKPHKIVDGNIVINKSKNGDKYKRQIFDKVAACVHTRNDQMASQNTIHPNQDRVFSIRELMKLMTIPNEFKWMDISLAELNSKSIEEKRKIAKKEELNIRQSIGEAVPTEIFRQIAENIKRFFHKDYLSDKELKRLIDVEDLTNSTKLKKFVIKNKNLMHLDNLAKLIELANKNRYSHSAFYTTKEVLNNVISILPNFDQDEINILEPSVGIGNFIPLLFKKYDYLKKVKLTVIDIDNKILELLKIIFDDNFVPSNFEIKFICDNYLKVNFDFKFDLVIGNPPFTKLSIKEFNKYNQENIYSKGLTNLAGLFLEKSLRDGKNISLILPKNLLNTIDYENTRKKLKDLNLSSILDFGEIGFKGVLIETIALSISDKKNSKVLVKSLMKNLEILQDKNYIFDDKLPYWVIYRNRFFDHIFNKLTFNVFKVFRDRQITNQILSNFQYEQNIKVIKSRNISDDGDEIINIDNYDSYINIEQAKKLTVYKYFNDDKVYFTPNMTYKPRLLKKQKGYIANGSIAILEKKYDIDINDAQRKYIASKEFRDFYAIARNFQTRSLNVDKVSVYWFGINKELV